jgi:cysteine desulfurase
MDDDAPVYLDAAATTPVDRRVAELVMACMLDDFGNAGSRTHEFGARANKLVEQARAQVAAVVDADPAEVVFTSGATEANNLALLGLASHGRASGRTHIVTTAIEHKAVLEPAGLLARDGFDVDFIRPDGTGAVDPEEVLAAVRSDTLLVSVMHVNNETGVRQPITAIADGLDASPFLHTDAAQGFGKVSEDLRHPRIDLISISGHKIFAPKGVGALVTRRRARRRPPLEPLLHGGGQERGLRPGTLPVPLIAGLGLAAELSDSEAADRLERVLELRSVLERSVTQAGGVINGAPDLAVPHILNVSFAGLDSQALILALRDVVAVSNGSACTSSTYEPSHVLTAMGLDDERRRGAIRLSWSHLTPTPDTTRFSKAINGLR